MAGDSRISGKPGIVSIEDRGRALDFVGERAEAGAEHDPKGEEARLTPCLARAAIASSLVVMIAIPQQAARRRVAAAYGGFKFSGPKE